MSVVVQHRRDSNTNVEANTPAAGELWMDTTKGEASLGTGALAGGVRMQKKNTREILVPAQISANTNDYNPTSLKHASVLVVSTDAARDITGIVPTTVTDTTDGREITVYNGGSFNATLKDQNAASSAANRFDLGGADLVLAPKTSATLRYRTSGGLNRWELVAQTAGAAVAAASVLARTLASSGVAMRAGLINGTIAESRAGGAATFALKTLAGSDPTTLDPVLAVFQNGSGGYVVRSVTAALSITVSSGSSLGVAANNAAFKIRVVAVDNAGTVALGVVNTLSGNNILPLRENVAYSTIAEGGAGAADNAQTIYTAATLASKFICLVGYAEYDSGLAATGTWNVAPTTLALDGPGVPKPGEMIHETIATYATNADLATTIPADDTIPQNTEGSQIISQAHLVQGASHKIALTFEGNGACGAGGQPLISALFFNSVANAIAAEANQTPAADLQSMMRIETVHLPGLKGSQTYAVRVGGAGATIRLNGISTARRFGGASAAILRIKEYAT